MTEPSRPADAPRSVGVVGAGVIGSSVAHAAVSVRRHQRLGRLTGGAPAQLDPRCTGDLDELSDVDILVENITESEAAKSALYKELDRVLRPETPIAANTSAIPITVLAAALADPSRVVGAHFMNPVALIDTVELVRAPKTSDAALATLIALLARMGKSWITVGDSPGFVINRVLMVVANLAAAIVAEGVATPSALPRLPRSPHRSAADRGPDRPRHRGAHPRRPARTPRDRRVRRPPRAARPGRPGRPRAEERVRILHLRQELTWPRASTTSVPASGSTSSAWSG
jgi:3-hydroxybutyryl-CoA dehydrogenase